MKEVRDAMPDLGIICLITASIKSGSLEITAYLPNTVLLDNRWPQWVRSLPSAMAANLVHPDKKLWRSAGTAVYDELSKLETAVRPG